jgi:hypothetical protein
MTIGETKEKMERSSKGRYTKESKKSGYIEEEHLREKAMS